MRRNDFLDFVAARRVVAFSSENSAVTCPNPQDRRFVFVQENRNRSNENAGSEKENPGALAGASGADLHSWLEWVDLNIQRESAARSLMEAVLACAPRDRIPLMERFIEAMRPGEPLPPFMGIMASARDWAAWASRAELKAYALACYEAMSGRDQIAFLEHINRRAAA